MSCCGGRALTRAFGKLAAFEPWMCSLELCPVPTQGWEWGSGHGEPPKSRSAETGLQRTRRPVADQMCSSPVRSHCTFLLYILCLVGLLWGWGCVACIYLLTQTPYTPVSPTWGPVFLPHANCSLLTCPRPDQSKQEASGPSFEQAEVMLPQHFLRKVFILRAVLDLQKSCRPRHICGN